MAHTHNGNDWRRGLEDLCGCQDIGCSDCREDAARTGAMDEAAAIDGACAAPSPSRTPHLPTTLPFAHMEIVSLNDQIGTLRKHIAERDAIIGRKVAYLTQLELAHADDAKRIENLVLTTRELEAAIVRRDEELVVKRTSLMHEINAKLDALARANSLQMSIYALEDRILGYERDMSGTVKELEDARDSNARKDEHIAELQSSLVMMTEMASEAAKDADKHLNIGAELSDLLTDSGKREDHAYETIAGIRALATSESLSDHERIALILRLI